MESIAILINGALRNDVDNEYVFKVIDFLLYLKFIYILKLGNQTKIHLHVTKIYLMSI